MIGLINYIVPLLQVGWRAFETGLGLIRGSRCEISAAGVWPFGRKAQCPVALCSPLIPYLKKQTKTRNNYSQGRINGLFTKHSFHNFFFFLL